MARIAINGFGRIGRMFFRQVFGGGDLDIVAVNDLGDKENLLYLLKYDTVYGPFEKQMSLKGNNLVVDGKEIQCSQEKDPSKLPWKDLEIDVVVEATGVFNTYQKARAHIDAGAKRLVLTAPSKDEDTDDAKTVLVGVNEEALATCTMSSNGSCTTNAAGPVIQILSKNPGIEKAILNTVHGYTATQSLVDGPSHGKDMRRGRAAAQNIIPSTTGAAIAVARAIHEMEDKFDGVAMRVPVLAGSVADITFIAKRDTTKDEINEILTKAASTPQWKNILKVTDDPIVSSDILGQPYGAIIDLPFTKVVDGNLVKVLSWYDNEFGYVSTLVKHVEAMAKTVK